MAFLFGLSNLLLKLHKIRFVQITFVLIDLADEEVATPVLDFFALENEDTKVLLNTPLVNFVYQTIR